MTETDITRRVLDDLRTQLRAAVIIKHHDVSTKGVPDIQVAIENRTSWTELKYLRRGRHIQQETDGPQVTLCKQLGDVNAGRSWFVAYEAGKKTATVWQAQLVFDVYFNRIEPGTMPIHDLEDLTADLVRRYGVVRVPWSYGIPSRLVLSTLGR